MLSTCLSLPSFFEYKQDQSHQLVPYPLKFRKNRKEKFHLFPILLCRFAKRFGMLPNRIDTVISSASHNLSGGQKQRLMIARMLLRKPAFITLDEATSSLDVETEKIIIQMLNEKMMDATVIVISHRFETIRNCQRIVVLNDHTVEAIGAHESLMEDSATYKALYGR